MLVWVSDSQVLKTAKCYGSTLPHSMQILCIFSATFASTTPPEFSLKNGNQVY